MPASASRADLTAAFARLPRSLTMKLLHSRPHLALTLHQRLGLLARVRSDAAILSTGAQADNHYQHTFVPSERCPLGVARLWRFGRRKGRRLPVILLCCKDATVNLNLHGLLAALIVHVSAARAQASPPTTNTLSRVLMVQSKYFAGTIFSIDVDKREYWITAKHILTGAKHPPFGSIADKSVTLRILNPGAQGEQWVSEPFSVIDPGEDIDIVVLAAPQPLLKDPLPSVATGSPGVLLGGDCEFLGYPSGVGGAWRGMFENGKSQWMPFIKHCTVSAESLVDKRIWFLDGINNEGFSGGPVIFLDRAATENLRSGIRVLHRTV